MSVRFLYEISELLMIVKFKDLDNYHDWRALENNTINKTSEQRKHLSLDSSPKSDCFLSQVAVSDCEIDRSESRVISDLREH